MDFESTQIFDESRTIKSNNDEDEKQIATLRIGSNDYPIMEGFNRIGRSPLCRVVLKDSTVSKIHADIQAGPEATYVTDLGSANGTIFKSLPLRKFFFYPINDGDVITFGQVSAVYKLLKKTNDQSVNVTPKTPVRKTGCSSKRQEDELSIDDIDESVIPGSQKNVNKKQRLFLRPSIPIERQKIFSRISDISENSEKTIIPDVSHNEDNISTEDIYDMETQDIVGNRKNLIDVASNVNIIDRAKITKISDNLARKIDNDNDIHEMETQDIMGRTRNVISSRIDVNKIDAGKKTTETVESSRKIENSNDIYEMETQDIMNHGSFNAKSSKKAAKSFPVSPDVFDDRVRDENIHEAETQILFDVKTKKLPISTKIPENEDSNTDDESMKVKKSSLAKNLDQVIEDSDDESKTEGDEDEERKIKKKVPRILDELSDDDSITDDENEFANSPLKAKRKVEQRGIADISKKIELEISSRRERMNLEKSIHDAETQRMQDFLPKRVNSTVAAPLIDEENDLELLPTQIHEVVTSTPVRILRKPENNDFNESQEVVTDDQDLHDALTQVEPKNLEIEEILRIKSPTMRNNDEKIDNLVGNLNDTIDTNMGNIFGDEAAICDDRAKIDETTEQMMMTQNLVDILKPTQNFTREIVVSPLIEDDEDASDEEFSIPKRKKTINEAVGTLGFVDGRAIDVGDEEATTSKSSMGRNVTLEVLSNDETEVTGCHEDDDILFGLPEVRISGTLSNPGSPTTSEQSLSDDDLQSRVTENSRKNSKASTVNLAITKKVALSPKILAKTMTKVDKTCVPDSPVLSTKFRTKRKLLSRNRIVDDDNDDDDDDTDDDLDYNDLKRIADKLLASDVTNNTKIRKNPEIPVKPMTMEKNVVVEKKITTKGRKIRGNVEKKNSSLIVTDHSVNDGNENKNVDSTSSRISRKRSRQTNTKNTNITSKKSLTTRLTNNDEIHDNLDDDDVNGEISEIPATIATSKTYAKVQLTRLNATEVRRKKESSVVVESNKDSTKSTRTRRLTTIPTTDLKSSPVSRVRGKNRRTIETVVPVVKEQYKILFTGVNDEDYEKMVVKLGGIVVSEPSKASVLITDKIRRTFKFLCAVAQGIKVVSIKWLIESNTAGTFLDCEKFILKDPIAEEKFRFKLAKSLNIAKTTKLLDGFTIIVTPKVNQPEIHEIKGMVEACGGRVLVRAGRTWDKKTVVISREDDLVAAKALISKSPKTFKITVQSTEFLLTGILRQEINLVDHKLL